MKLTGFCDFRLIKHDNKYYTHGKATLERNFTRYMPPFEEFAYMGRVVEGNIDDKIVIDDNRISLYPNDAYKNQLQYFIQNKKISKPVKSLVSQSESCVLHFPAILSFIAAKECIKQNKPWFAEVAGSAWDTYWNYGGIPGKILALPIDLLCKYYIKKAPYALYVTEDFLQKKYPCKGVTLGCSDVVISDIKEETLMKRIERINKLNNQDIIVVGLIGSLNVDYKGHKTAIKAISRLRKNGYEVRLRILGTGDKSRWVKLAHRLKVVDNIEFCGTLPSGKPVFQWLDDIDIYIHPSKTEGLPRSVVEAMSRACPVLATNVGGIPELINSSCLFEVNDNKTLSLKIAELIDNKEQLVTLSKNNFQMSKLFTKDNLDMKRLRFFEQFKNYADEKSRGNKKIETKSECDNTCL